MWMTSAHAWFLVPFVVLACGQYTGPQANATYFWQVKTSTLEFGACSDEAMFRGAIEPLAVGDNTFFIYKVTADGKRAVVQNCTWLDDTTCTESDGGVVFDIAGRELTFIEADKSPVNSTGCSLQQTRTWTLTDATKAMTLDISNVLGLVDSPSACLQVENELKARSPNMLGVEGCVITSKLTGELK